MKKFTTLLFLLVSITVFSQIKGKVINTKGKALPFVSIYLENTLTGTTTNDDGFYELPIKNTGNYTVIFQFLGYKTAKKSINIDAFPFELNVKLTSEEVVLDEVLISSKENPANRIIRNVIKSKEKNTEKWKNYTANFYSRGLFKIKDAPKKFLGRELGDFGGGLDSTRSGIIYLSETVSNIKFQKNPKEFKEHIVASKVSGRDNGISFNQARDVNFNLYKNQVPVVDAELFSPISDYAFSYYKYKLEGSFYENDKLINKIQLIPRNENDRVFGGYIYVVEDDWEIYGADLTATGEQIGNLGIDVLRIKQNYNFDTISKSWVLILQTIDFKVGMLGFNLNGRFSASYKNYNFNPNFTEDSFNNTILSFEENATKKDTSYWNNLRTVPLTSEEKTDYTAKDSIKTLRKSKTYLDSLDVKRNKFSLLSPITGYTYRNSHKKWRLNYGGIIENIDFNTVQGFAPTLNFNYSKRNNDHGNRWNIGTNLNYGFSDKKFRPTLYFSKRWNNYDKPVLNISGGNKIVQFDSRNPITKLDNAIYTLLGKRNYAKYYEKNFARIGFGKEVTRGIRLSSSLEYADRKPLFNTTDYSFFKKDRIITTNNPVDGTNPNSIFSPHHIFTGNITGTFNFGSKYMEYPNARYSISNPKYPTLSVGYRKTFGSGNNNLHSDLFWARLQQDFSLGNIGDFEYNIRAGKFLKQKNIAFMDYYHPMGNQTILSPENRMSSFNLLPYYQLSTNDTYAELHAEHNFKGFLLGKIPLLKKLNFHTVITAKSYFSGNTKPYTEYGIGLDNIGWGKYRFLRVDYVRSNFNGVSNDGFIFGFNLSN